MTSHKSSSPPTIGITIGDPCGIGPEITVKALSLPRIYNICHPIVIGASSVILKAIEITSANLRINKVTGARQAKFTCGTIDIIDMNNFDVDQLRFGQINAAAGRAAGEYIEKAVSLALQDRVDGIATAPINKESFKLGGYGDKYPGHTEMLAGLTNTKNYAMMLLHGNLRVMHVTTHVPLRDVPELVKKERVLNTIKLANYACNLLGIASPKIAVAGLNPHSGEHGLFGKEEAQEIEPAISEAARLGLNVCGPFSPDVVFSKAKGGEYDIVVVMYHDQGHIPLKLSGFVWDGEAHVWHSISGVNVTVGLPFIRASPDHGSSFGKAGKGTATAESMIEAIDVAATMAHTMQELSDSGHMLD